MNIKSTLCILGLISKIYAAKFSVVSFNGNCKVNVGGNSYELTKEKSGVPLYSAEIDVPVNSKYKYVCNGEEDVERTLTGNTTHNELFGRALTEFNMPEFGYPTAEPWTRSIGRTELFDPKFVPIVVLDGGDMAFYKGDKHSTTVSSISFILKDNVFTFNNVPISGKNYDENKFQFKVDLPDGGIYNRDSLKFRPSSYDPVFFRQMLYGDIAHAIGNPAHESVASRVYLSDGTGIGLYVLQEDCTTESFVKTAFFGDPKTGKVSNYQKRPIYDCATGSDFTNDDPQELGGFINHENENDPKNELIELITKIAELNIMDDNAVKNLDENWLDLDTLFRALALEYLAGHWDSYWFLTTNFVTYHPFDEEAGEQYNHSKYKFYFVDQDFDQTWGSNMKESLQSDKYPSIPYTNYINRDIAFWQKLNSDEYDSGSGRNLDAGNRVLLNKFLGCDGKETCSTKKLFENHLKSIVQHIFNPVAMKRKTDGYKARLSEEVKWDYNLKRLHVNPKHIYDFTYDDFERGIDGPTSQFPYGILDWTTEIANNICKMYQMEYDKEPYTPETAAKQKVEKIDPGMTYDTQSSLNAKSGAIQTTSNLAMIVLASILSIIYLF